MKGTEVLGDAAEMEVAAVFRRLGYVVGSPWGKAPFDLFVWGQPLGLCRVEVKSTTQRGHVCRGGKEWGWVVVVDATKCFDYLYVHTPDVHYLIPHFALGDKRRGVTVPSADDIAAGSRSGWLPFLLESRTR